MSYTDSSDRRVGALTRRQFLALTVAGVSIAGAAIPLRADEHTQNQNGETQYRTLGRTGQKVSIMGIGGGHLRSIGEPEVIRVARTAIDNGATFMDNCWDYNCAVCEERMGKTLRDGYWQRVFLMTKTDGRVRETAAQRIDKCLKRLQTDHLGLDPVPRSNPDVRPRPDFRARRRNGGAGCGATSRQDPLHRLHWTQKLRDSSAHAQDSRTA